MLNIIRADFYRLRHSKGFYITQLILIAFVATTVLNKSLGTIGVVSDNVSNFQNGATQAKWSAILAVENISSMANILIYFLLPLFIMTIGFDFKGKTYKNVLPIGVSRGKYFLSKYVTFILLVFLQFVFFYGITFLVGGIKYGFGDINGEILLQLLKAFGIQFLMINAIFAIAMLVIYITFSNVSSVLATILLPLMIPILLALSADLTYLKYFDFQSMINAAVFVKLTSHEWAMFLMAACGTIIACMLGSQFVFSKKEL